MLSSGLSEGLVEVILGIELNLLVIKGEWGSKNRNHYRAIDGLYWDDYRDPLLSLKHQ